MFQVIETVIAIAVIAELAICKAVTVSGDKTELHLIMQALDNTPSHSAATQQKDALCE